MKRALYARRPIKTALPASRALHHTIVRFIKNCAPDNCKSPIKVYFNQGRNLYPDRITILHLPAEIRRGLEKILSDWTEEKNNLVWGCRVQKVAFPPSEEIILLVFLELKGKVLSCTDCNQTGPMLASKTGKNPTVKCVCGTEFPFPMPLSPKEKRHYRAAVR